ncbi:MAG TPA: glycosyltransferase family A protein [Hanamia sp.]
MDDKISVIIPCYNQAHFLNESVGSVLAQTYTNWECIIVNDGSTDNTESVALAFTEKDSRIKYIEKENGGLSSARNKGLDEAAGDYIQFLDSDDMITSDKFETSLNNGNDADVIISGFKMFSKDNLDIPLPFKLSEKDFNFNSILLGWDVQFVFPPHSGIFKSYLFENLRFNETLGAREDWLMWLEIYRKNIKTVFIDEPLALYRSSSDSMSQKRFLMDQSLVAVYKIVYPSLSLEQKDMFFKKVMGSFEKVLIDYSILLDKTRQSKSYRLGNFFVRNFNKITKLKK